MPAGLVRLTLGRERIVPVAVGALDSAIPAVDYQLSSLVATDLASGVDGLSLGVPMTTGTLTTAALYIPAASRVREDVMRVSGHVLTPCELQGSKLRSHRRRCSTPSPLQRQRPHLGSSQDKSYP